MTELASRHHSVAAPRKIPILHQYERRAITVILMIVSIIAAAISCHVVDYNGEIDDVVLFLLLFLLCGMIAARYKMNVIENILKIVFLILISDLTVPLASAALATTALPLADSYFVEADRLIFRENIWPDLISTYPTHPSTLKALSYAYISIGWQPFLLTVFLCLRRQFELSWRFATAWIISLFLCLLVFPWCPGVGAYSYFNIAPADVPEILVRSAWHYPVTLQKFRIAATHHLDLASLDGLIAMPSFHACASVLLAWGFSHIRVLSLPFAILNIMMWVSSVPIGGHYCVDVLAGSLVALTALHVSSQRTLRISRSREA